MEKITDTEVVEDKFIRAEDLRDITLTPEELFEIQKENICTTIMESMIGVATKNGALAYSTNILESMSEAMRTAIVDRFTELGYVVTLSDVLQTEQQTQRGLQKIEYRIITLSWQEESSTNGDNN